MKNEQLTIEEMKAELDRMGPPYKTFSFRVYPFRWLFCFILWNIGATLRGIGERLKKT